MASSGSLLLFTYKCPASTRFDSQTDSLDCFIPRIGVAYNGIAMPRSDGGTTLDELTVTDLEAYRVLGSWEWKPEVVLVPVRPCEWQDCGGSVLLWSGEARCLLCCRLPAG